MYLLPGAVNVRAMVLEGAFCQRRDEFYGDVKVDQEKLTNSEDAGVLGLVP